jgi:hypothetical protein
MLQGRESFLLKVLVSITGRRSSPVTGWSRLRQNRSQMSLVYPAYVFWENDLAFHEIKELRDIEFNFEMNDICDENLRGWDSDGRRFAIAWDKKRACGYPAPGDIDLPGLEEKVALFNRHRTDDHPYFAESDVVNGECSPRVVNKFLARVRDSLQSRDD